MAVKEKEKNMKCWPFVQSAFRVPLFVAKIELFLTSSGKWGSQAIQLIVDTGYDGDLLLNYDLYESLGFLVFEEDQEEWDIAESVTGDQILLRSSHSKIRLEEREFTVRIESFQENEESLIGRGLLRRLFSEINGFKQEFCCATEEKE
jgi:clan AA aspartic protease